MKTMEKIMERLLQKIGTNKKMKAMIEANNEQVEVLE
jgi:hypothetical protein